MSLSEVRVADLCPDGRNENTMTPGHAQARASMQKGPKSTESGVKLTVCELLYFVSNTIDVHPVSTLRNTVLEFYREDEVMAAKQLLVQAVESVDCIGIQPLCKRRIGDNKVKTSVDDILNIFRVLDEGSQRDKLPVFCAVSRARVPQIADELSDLAAIRLEITQMRRKIEELAEQNQKQCRCSCKDLLVEQENDNAGAPNPCGDGANNTTKPKAPASSNGSSPTVDVVDIEPNPSADANDVQNCNKLTQKRTVADVLKENIDDFKKVERKRKKPVVFGGATADSLPLKGVVKKTVACISRLEPGTTDTVVVEHLRKKGVNVLSCFPHEDNRNRYVFMRICVPQTDAHIIYDAKIWPVGVVVRPWKFKSAVGDQNDHL